MKKLKGNTRHITLRGAPVTALLCAATVWGGLASSAPAAEPTAAVRTASDVVVTASRVPTDPRKVGSALTVITAEDLEKRQNTVVSDILRSVPGLAVNRSGPVGRITQVRIRGAEANQTLVIIDGIEVNDIGNASEFNFGNLVASDIERIEVLRGPQSAIWGSDAVGGVINIITKKGRGGPSVQAGFEGGSFRTREGFASVRGGNGMVHYSLGGNWFRTDGVSVARPEAGNSEDDGYRNKTVNAKLGFTPTKYLELDAVGRWVQNVSQFDATPFAASPNIPADSDSQTAVRQREGRVQAKVNLFDGAWEHIVGLSYNEDESITSANNAVTSTAGGVKTKVDYQTNIYFDTPVLADASHTVTLALEREREDFLFTGFTTVDRDVTNYGYVGEYRVDLLDRLFLSASLRFDENDISANAATHRFTGAYLLKETETRFHGSYGKGVKNPTFFELFGFATNFTGNPNLSPEESRGWDAGVEQRFLDDRATVDVTYFSNRIRDLIQGFGSTAVNLSGTTKIKGVEVTGDVEIVDGLDLGLQYTYTLGQDSDGLELVRRPKHIAAATLNYRFLDDRANVNLSVAYNGEQKDFKFFPFPTPFQRTRLDDYTLVNLAGSYQVTDNIQLFARVENLLDEDYEEVFGFNTTGIGAAGGIRLTYTFSGPDKPGKRVR